MERRPLLFRREDSAKLRRGATERFLRFGRETRWISRRNRAGPQLRRIPNPGARLLASLDSSAVKSGGQVWKKCARRRFSDIAAAAVTGGARTPTAGRKKRRYQLPGKSLAAGGDHGEADLPGGGMAVVRVDGPCHLVVAGLQRLQRQGEV